MSIITITSDWSKSDYYLSAIKGGILCQDSSSAIVDITKDIPPMDVLQAMFILRSSYARFPKGTIHLMAVASEPTPETPMVIIEAAGQYFVSINDGRFTHLFDTESPCSIEEVPPVAYALRFPKDFSTFMAADQFTEAVRIILNKSFLIDTDKCNIKKEVVLRPMCNENTIVGKVIYIDSFGNAITNITKNLFTKMIAGRDYEVLVQGPYAKIPTISRDYSSVRAGEMVAIFNSLGYLEIAINQGNVSETENLQTSSEITIKFINEIEYKLNIEDND